jgi:hypothetical protein
VSGALSKAQERGSRGLSGLPPVVRSLAAVVLFPFDDVLRGMVTAGQGIEALCLFLGLTRRLLDDHLARLGLATPHDRPLRKPGVHGWSVVDAIRLIAWRMAGVHPEIIGERLGRTAGGVRSKARRLGLRPPPRKLLHKPDPKTLRDPEPGFGWRGPPHSPAPFTPEAACGRSAGVISFRGRDVVETLAQGTEKAIAGKIAGFFGRSIGQRELPLFGVVGGTDRHPVEPRLEQNDKHIAHLARPIPEFIIPKTETEVDFNGDLTWIGKIRRPLTNKLVVWICGMLYLGGLHYAEAAKRVGMTAPAFRTFKTRASIPVEVNRKKFGNIFDEQGARATLAASGHKLRKCISASDGGGNWFWVERNDFCTRLSPPKRKRDHDIEGRFNRIMILKGSEARPISHRILAPFAQGDGRDGCNRNSWSAAHA